MATKTHVFITTKLQDNKVLVEGSAKGQAVILDATTWNAAQQILKDQLAQHKFDAEVEKFFAPILAASEKLDASLSDGDPEEDMSFFVITPPVQGREAQKGEAVQLDKDGTILRCLYSAIQGPLWVNVSGVWSIELPA